MKKIVLIGAGSAVFGLGTVSDVFQSLVLEGATITLHDINSNNLKKTKEIANKYKQKFGVNFTIEATTDRTEALKNSDFCIISISAWDLHIRISSKIEDGSARLIGPMP